MTNRLRRLIGAAFAAVCLSSSSAARAEVDEAHAARALVLEDIVALEAFGRAALSPNGRWAVYEKRGPYRDLPAFDYAQRSHWTGMDLWLVDLARPAAPPERLLPGAGPGLLRVAWSPSGGRLLIYRLQGARFEIGVVSMSDRSVRWTGLTPDIPGVGASAEWMSEDQVVLMTRPDGSLPALLRLQAESQARMTASWARTSRGHDAARTIIDADDGVAASERAEPPQAVVLLDAIQGDVRTLVEGPITDFSVSPDRRAVAVVAGAEGAPAAPDVVLQADSARRQRLSLISLEDGAVAHPAEDLDVAPHLLRWSPDSSAVLVWARRDDQAWADGGLAVVLADRVVSPRTEGLTPGSSAEILRGVRADWIGERPVLYARPRDGDRFDWHLLAANHSPRTLTADLPSAPGQLAATDGRGPRLFADGALWRMDARGLHRLTQAGQGLRPAVAGDPEAVARFRINNAPRQDWDAAFTAEGANVTLSRDGRMRGLGSGASTIQSLLAVSASAALVLERQGLVETLKLRLPSRDIAIDSVNEAMAGVATATPTAISHLDDLGRPTQSQLFMPPGLEPRSVRGLVVHVYPGSTYTGLWAGPLGLTYGIRTEVLASTGFAVLSPSIPADAAASQGGDHYLRSVDLAVDAALAAYPDLPADRIVVVGHSFGGRAALAIAARTRRYRAYVASAPPTDMFGFWGELPPATRILPEDGIALRFQQGWVEAGQGGLEETPWAAPETYAEASPYLDAATIQDPVLLITADRDYVPMSQSERIFSVLYRQGGRARLVTYWGEHHALWSPANILDRYREIFAWIEAGISAPAEPNPPAQGGAPTP